MTILTDVPKPEAQVGRTKAEPGSGPQRFRDSTPQMHFLNQLIEHHGGDLQRTAEALGYAGRSSIDGWKKANAIPVTAHLAAEALCRRLGRTGRQSDPLVLGYVAASHATVKTVLEALGGEFVFTNFDAETRSDAKVVSVVKVLQTNAVAFEAVVRASRGTATRLEL